MEVARTSAVQTPPPTGSAGGVTLIVEASRRVSPGFLRLDLVAEQPLSVPAGHCGSLRLRLGSAGSTVRRVPVVACDASCGQVSVDVPLVGGCDAVAAWAETAAVGSVLRSDGLDTVEVQRDDARTYFLAADAASTPAVRAALRQIPTGRFAHALLEAHTVADALPVDATCAVNVTWLHPSMEDKPLERAVAALPCEGIDHWVIAAASPVANRVLEHLIAVRAVSAAAITVLPSWS